MPKSLDTASTAATAAPPTASVDSRPSTAAADRGTSVAPTPVANTVTSESHRHCGTHPMVCCASERAGATDIELIDYSTSRTNIISVAAHHNAAATPPAATQPVITHPTAPSAAAAARHVPPGASTSMILLQTQPPNNLVEPHGHQTHRSEPPSRDIRLVPPTRATPHPDPSRLPHQHDDRRPTIAAATTRALHDRSLWAIWHNDKARSSAPSSTTHTPPRLTTSAATPSASRKRRRRETPPNNDDDDAPSTTPFPGTPQHANQSTTAASPRAEPTAQPTTPGPDVNDPMGADESPAASTIMDDLQQHPCHFNCGRKFRVVRSLAQHHRSCPNNPKNASHPAAAPPILPNFPPSLLVDEIPTQPLPIAHFVLRFDGACPGNGAKNIATPGGAGAALFNAVGTILWQCHHYLPDPNCTNNDAEYTGLLLGLAGAAHWTPRLLRVEGDSNLVIQQLNHKLAARTHSTRSYLSGARTLVAALEAMGATVIFHHIDRQLNAIADALANQALGIDKDHAGRPRRGPPGSGVTCSCPAPSIHCAPADIQPLLCNATNMSHVDYRVHASSVDAASFLASLTPPPPLPPVSDPFRSGRVPRAAALRGRIPTHNPVASALPADVAATVDVEDTDMGTDEASATVPASDTPSTSPPPATSASKPPTQPLSVDASVAAASKPPTQPLSVVASVAAPPSANDTTSSITSTVHTMYFRAKPPTLDHSTTPPRVVHLGSISARVYSPSGRELWCAGTAIRDADWDSPTQHARAFLLGLDGLDHLGVLASAARFDICGDGGSLLHEVWQRQPTESRLRRKTRHRLVERVDHPLKQRFDNIHSPDIVRQLLLDSFANS
ncbi:hypothetical protein As57867_017073, partial [Aphanomyces stellatus]